MEECLKHFNSLHFYFGMFGFTLQQVQRSAYMSEKWLSWKFLLNMLKCFEQKDWRGLAFTTRTQIEQMRRQKKRTSNLNPQKAINVSVAFTTTDTLLRLYLLSLPPSTVIPLTPLLKEEKVKWMIQGFWSVCQFSGSRLPTPPASGWPVASEGPRLLSSNHNGPGEVLESEKRKTPASTLFLILSLSLNKVPLFFSALTKVGMCVHKSLYNWSRIKVIISLVVGVRYQVMQPCRNKAGL